MRGLQNVRAIYIMAVSFAMFQSCNQNFNHEQSPTAASTVQKADSTAKKESGEKKVSGVQPLVPNYNQGAIYYGGTEWSFQNYVPATSHNGTYTLLHATIATLGQLDTLHNYYGFTRATLNYTGVSGYSPVFGLSNLLIRIGYQNVDANWDSVVNVYGNSVLGYMIDEPSDKVSASTIQSIASYIHSHGSSLWLDDYDTSVEPTDDYPCYSGHLADWSALNSCDYLMCDADNTTYTNGGGVCGTWLAENYNAFLGYQQPPPPTPVFNTIYTTPPYTSEGDVTSWMDTHLSQIKTFGLYLGYPFSWTDVATFAQYAYQAGYLGEYQEQEEAKYTCQQNAVLFDPGSSGTAGSYYGVWNGSGYTGPVDPSTQGAVLCWLFTGWNPMNQYQTVYAQ